MKELFDLLLRKNITVATAESCTGGNIAAEFVSYPGISRVFLAGLVTYANSAKENILGVLPETLENFGAVSTECADEMLAGCQNATGAQTCICTTGIAGPGGGSAKKPVGLVYVGVRYKNKNTIKKCLFKGGREDVIKKAAQFALNLLLEIILSEENDNG